jgi:hypothetical protein
VTGESESAKGAVESTKAVLEEIDAVLVQLQEQDETADPKYFITSDPLQSPSTAAPLYGSTVRAAIAALVVGSLGTLGLALIAETLGPRVKAWRTRSTDATSEAGAAAESPEAGLSSGSGDPSEDTEHLPAEEETAMAEPPAPRRTPSDNGHVRRSRAGTGHSQPASERGP